MYGAVAIAGLPVAYLYASGRPFPFALVELATAAGIAIFWARHQWPISAPLNLLLLGFHYAFWLAFSVVKIGLVIRPWDRWGVWDYVVLVLPILGFLYSLAWATYFRRAEA
jgi:hypothetical protein